MKYQDWNVTLGSEWLLSLEQHLIAMEGHGRAADRETVAAAWAEYDRMVEAWMISNE